MEAIIFLSIIITLFSIFVSCLVIRRVKKQIAEITDALADVKKWEWKQADFISNK